MDITETTRSPSPFRVLESPLADTPPPTIPFLLLLHFDLACFAFQFSIYLSLSFASYSVLVITKPTL